MTEETDNMKKTLWMAFGTCAALTAGMFLYEGGVLFFGYHDRRMGVYVLASGILVTSSFLWSLYKSCSGEKCADRMKRAEECGTILSAGMAVLGITIYSMRYMNHPLVLKVLIAETFLLLLVLVIRLLTETGVAAKGKKRERN